VARKPWRTAREAGSQPEKAEGPGDFEMPSVKSIASRLALFVMGHVMVLGLVGVVMMSGGRAGTQPMAPDTMVTGSIR